MKNILEQLFGSKTRVNVMRTFFQNDGKAFFVRELTRHLDVQINAIRRELELLLRVGLIVEVDPKSFLNIEEKDSRRRKYYSVNLDSPIYSQMKALLVKEQLLEERELLDQIIGKGGEVKFFLVTGRFTAEKKASTDMLIVGKIKDRVVAKIIQTYEKKFGVDIRYTTMSVEEFFERRHMMDKFLFSLFECNHIRIANELEV